MQPVTCHYMPPSVTFNPSSYSVYVGYTQVSIRPENPLVTGCSVTPTLPAGLSLNAATCTISGVPTVTMPSTIFTMTSEIGDGIEGTFTLFIHSSVSPLVPEGSSPSHILHLRARTAIASGALYLDSTDSADTLALTGLSMEANEVKSVYAALPAASYTIHATDLDVIVLKDVNPTAAFIGDDVLNGQFSTTPVCEESLDVECNIVVGADVTVKEVGAASDNTYSNLAIVPLDRAKSYEMCVRV